jgi:hypothetical protein
MGEIIDAQDQCAWRDALADFKCIDVCHMPEYHQAYSLRFPGTQPLMWSYQVDGERLCYPFLLSPVILSSENNESVVTGYHDISGIYGYSGPLTTNSDQHFLNVAWEAFDHWAIDQNIVSEFIRFSTYVNNKNWAHPKVQVDYNRPVALALLPENTDTFLQQLNSKTRNMIRKALKSELVSREMPIREGLDAFRKLYMETMERNQATGFFRYDDNYYDLLLSLPEDELLLFAVYQGNEMVAAAIGLVYGDMAFYHLGASTQDASRFGAGNLVLFEMASGLIKRNISFFSVGGGRTMADDDPLFKFKKNNSTSVGDFYIGKRVIQPQAYQFIIEQWQTINPSAKKSDNLQFYR